MRTVYCQMTLYAKLIISEKQWISVVNNSMIEKYFSIHYLRKYPTY